MQLRHCWLNCRSEFRMTLYWNAWDTVHWRRLFVLLNRVSSAYKLEASDPLPSDNDTLQELHTYFYRWVIEMVNLDYSESTNDCCYVHMHYMYVLEGNEGIPGSSLVINVCQKAHSRAPVLNCSSGQTMQGSLRMALVTWGLFSNWGSLRLAPHWHLVI